MKKNNNKYILNPAYTLMSDINRAVITDSIIVRDFPNANQSFTSFIHPLCAIMLTYFDGKKTFDDCVERIATDLEFDYDEIYLILSLLVENENEECIAYKGITSCFPSRVLINNNLNYKPVHYDCRDFIIPHDKLDMVTRRFNKPITATLILNFDCVTKCVYCYADKRNKSYEPLSLDRIISLIREAKSIGMKNIDITGGELFLHKDWEIILKTLLDSGFIPYVSTKIPLTKEMIARYKDIGMTQIQISLDSVNPDILSKQLLVDKDYWNRMEQTFKNLEEFGIKVIINSIITSISYSDEELTNLVLELNKYPNIAKIQFNIAGHSLYLSVQENERLALSATQVPIIKAKVEALQALTDKEVSFAGVNLKKESFRVEHSEFTKRALCTGNRYAFAILPDGRETYCEELYWHPQFILGDLNKQSILEMWQSDHAKELFMLSQTKIRAESPCAPCNEYDKCHGTPGVCWKDIIGSYGFDNWDYPDPRCPLAPEPIQPFFII